MGKTSADDTCRYQGELEGRIFLIKTLTNNQSLMSANSTLQQPALGHPLLTCTDWVFPLPVSGKEPFEDNAFVSVQFFHRNTQTPERPPLKLACDVFATYPSHR